MRLLKKNVVTSSKVLIVGVVLKSYGGHTRFVEALMNSGLPYKFVLFDPGRPPKDHSKSQRPSYRDIFDAGIMRTILGVAITLYHMLVFPLVLLKERPQVVHFAGGGFWRFWEYAIYIQLCRLCRIKTIYHWLANFDDWYGLSGQRSRHLIKRIMEQVDRHIVLSKLDKKCVDSISPKDNVHFLPGGISSSFITQLYDQTLPAKLEEICILFIGGRDPARKGIFDILKAYSIVVRNEQNTRLILTGGGNVEDAIKKSAGKDVMPYLSFLGYVSESQKIDLYKSADMLLLPSCQEGLPYVVLEAMAAGLPVISTYVGGIPDVIEDNVNGFLIQPGDYEALAERILFLNRDQNLRKRISQANREKILKQYSEEAIIQRLGQIYDELCSTSA